MIKLLKVFFQNSILLVSLSLASLVLSNCTMAPGMKSNLIQDEISDNYKLNFFNFSEIDLSTLPVYDERYTSDISDIDISLKVQEYRYLLGKSDVINLSVTDNEEIQGDFVVDGQGEISLPYVGNLKIVDLTKLQAAELITQSLQEYYQDPEVILDIIEFNSRYIYITGEVQKPQAILLNDKELKLRDAILQSGYIKDQKTFDKKALLKRGENLYQIDLFALFNEIDNDLNIFLLEDDVVHIQKKFADKVFVFGEGTQGQYNLYDNINLTTLLANAKINQQTAEANKIYLIRQDDQRKSEINIYQLEGKNPTKLILANNINLLPNDVLYISASNLVQWNRVISLITPQTGLTGTATDIQTDLKQIN